nr:hypothetical protein [uncultured Carboxylicivirga sp.]
MRTLLLTLTLICSIQLFGQTTPKFDLTAYIHEVQIWDKQDNNMALTWWIPLSYWRMSLEGSPQVTPEVIDQVEQAFENYVVICALDLYINPDGSMRYTSEQDLRKTLSVEDSTGNQYYPLTNAQLSAEALSFSEAIKPMFAQMLGQLGKGMAFYFFEIKDNDGNNVFNEFEEGKLIVKHSARTFTYNLPLVVLLPPKHCPVDGEEMKGNWNYCPIHGAKL